MLSYSLIDMLNPSKVIISSLVDNEAREYVVLGKYQICLKNATFNILVVSSNKEI